MNEKVTKEPAIPVVMRICDCLEERKILSQTEQNLLYNAEQGYTGECEFYAFLQDAASNKLLLLSSLSLRANNANFQIDSILINNETIYLFEVKNYAGDYYISKNRWFSHPARKEISNPFIQLKRSEGLLRQLLATHGIDYPIKAYVVFVNPEFTLFNASINYPLILRSQFSRFFRPSFFQQTPYSDKDFYVAQFLMDSHQDVIYKDNLPSYTFAELKKGIKCPKCGRFMRVETFYRVKCSACLYIERNESAVLRSINDFKFLFPEMKITTKNIVEWCNILSARVIRRILSNYLERRGQGRSTHYIFK